MSHGPGIMQREILRRASARRNTFSVREMGAKLFVNPNETELGAVRRAVSGLVKTGYLIKEEQPARRAHRGEPITLYRLGTRQRQRPEWSTPLEIVQIDWTSADAMLDGNHYLGAAGYPPTFCLTTPSRDALALFAPPVASHFKKVLASPLELTRLWRDDACPWPLSKFLSRALRWIKTNAPETDCVFSYADPGAINPVTGRPHVGGIYTASNFAFLGEARATDHWLDDHGAKVSAPQCYRLFKTKSVARMAELRPSWVHCPGSAKLLYAFPLRMKLADVLERIGGPGSRYNPGAHPPAGRRPTGAGSIPPSPVGLRPCGCKQRSKRTSPARPKAPGDLW